MGSVWTPEDFYYRNPTPIGFAVNLGATVPHGLTSRATYTVPAGRRTWLTMIQGKVIRQTVGAPAGQMLLMVRIGGVERLFVPLAPSQNAINDTERVQLGGLLALVSAGVLVEALTLDQSTGGSGIYQLWLSGVEFDAL